MGIPTLISTATASDAANVDITSGIDSTYDEYMFVFTDIGPSSDDYEFTFQVNVAGASGFDETMTTTLFSATNLEADESALAYVTGNDQAQGTAYQTIAMNVGSGSDKSTAGILHLFSPSNTTFVTHFYSRFNTLGGQNLSRDDFTAGYINATAAVDEISFKMSGGNLDGVIQMYGIA